MKTIKTALVGLGRIGWEYHLPNLENNAGFELIALVDPLEDRLKEASEQTGAKLYTSYERMLVHEQPELVVVASPTHFHYEQILKAFKAGAWVLTEKPLALNLTETEKIISEMRRLDKKLTIYQPRRFDPECQQAKDIINSGKLGSLHEIKRCVQKYSRRNDWQAMSCYGGGMLNNYGAHYIDQLLYICQLDFKCQYSNLKCIASLGNADDFFKLILHSESGILADLEVSESSGFGTDVWELSGKYGTARFNKADNNWIIRYFNPDELQPLKMQNSLAAHERSYSLETIPWQEEVISCADLREINFYDKLYDYLVLDKAPPVNINDTWKVMKIIKSSLELGKEK